jgi:hypothetical protein
MWWSPDDIHVMPAASATSGHITALSLAFQVVCRQAAHDDLAMSKIFVSVLEYTYHRMQSHPTQGGIPGGISTFYPFPSLRFWGTY